MFNVLGQATDLDDYENDQFDDNEAETTEVKQPEILASNPDPIKNETAADEP